MACVAHLTVDLLITEFLIVAGYKRSVCMPKRKRVFSRESFLSTVVATNLISSWIHFSLSAYHNIDVATLAKSPTPDYVESYVV